MFMVGAYVLHTRSLDNTKFICVDSRTAAAQIMHLLSEANILMTSYPTHRYIRRDREGEGEGHQLTIS